jgi:hypothetical protein
MDCDLSHDPAALPRLAAAAAAADVVSARGTWRGKTTGWPWYRRLVARGRAWPAGRSGLPVHDVTGGFEAGTGRCWALPLEEVRCRAAFQIEMNYLCWREVLHRGGAGELRGRRRTLKMSLAIGLETAALL